MDCLRCGATDQQGNFCAQCGAALGGGCPSCGAEMVPGGRYCTQCGERLRRARARPHPAWFVAGAALLLAVLVLFIPDRTDRAGPGFMTAPPGGEAGGRPTAGGRPAGEGRPAGAPLLGDDMRSNADRLFNRIMAAAERGDRAEVARFMPMAVEAYGLVEDLDSDGLYHLAILHRTAGQPEQALEAAGRILEASPDHILALGVAGAAAAQAGDSARARELYRRLLDAYETEAAEARPEYLDHRGMLPEYRRAAAEHLDAG